MIKEQYERASVEIINIEKSDVIVTSPGNNTPVVPNDPNDVEE